MTRNRRTKRHRVALYAFAATAIAVPLLFTASSAVADIDPNCQYGPTMTSTDYPWLCTGPRDPQSNPEEATTDDTQPTAAMFALEKSAVAIDMAHGEVDSTEGNAEIAALNGDPGATSPARDSSAEALPVGSTAGDPDGEVAAEQPNTGATYHCGLSGCWFRYNNDSMTYDSFTIHYGWLDYDRHTHELGTMFFHQRTSLHPPPPRATAKNYSVDQWGYMDFGRNKIHEGGFGGALASGAARWGGGVGTVIGSQCRESYGYNYDDDVDNTIYPSTDPFCNKQDFSHHDHAMVTTMLWEPEGWNIRFFCDNSALVSHTNSLGRDAAYYYFHTFQFTHWGMPGINPITYCGADSVGYASAQPWRIH